MFFEEAAATIRIAINSMPDSLTGSQVVQMCYQYADHLESSSLAYEEACPRTIKRYEKKINRDYLINRTDVDPNKNLSIIINFFVEIAYEKFFRIQEYYMNSDLYFLKLLDSKQIPLSEDEKKSLDLSIRNMPLQIAKESYVKLAEKENSHRKSIDELFESTNQLIDEKIDSAKNEAETLNKEIQDLRLRLDGQRDYINDIKSSYNFVGLAHAFENIETQKRSTRQKILILLFSISALVILIPISSAYLSFESITATTWEEHISNTSKVALLILPVEIILIYFFRVVLSNFSSISTQIVQLELRQSLCAFIQSYVEYKQELGNEISIDRFEEIIFSGIVMDPGQIPQTFDGLEKLAATLNAFRKTS